MYYGEPKVKDPIRWGMVGGGQGAAIGYIHRSAALRDQHFELVAGAFDIDVDRGREFGTKLHVVPERCYADYKQMFVEESKREDGIQAVSIATPNNTHYEISKAALEHNLHVYCEKPLCFTTEEARELEELAEKTERIFAVSYGYAGHQMLLQGREMIERGDLGDIRMIHMYFSHGANAAESADLAEGQKWRVNPKTAGPSFVLGDLGTHPLYLAEMMAPDIRIDQLLCEKKAFIKQREPLEDNAYILLRYANGAEGFMWVSSVNCGALHGLKVRIMGSKASIEWWAEHPNQLTYEQYGQPVQTLERGTDYLYDIANVDNRMGAGHAEGLFESWSNLYYRFAQAIDARERGDEEFLASHWYPDVRAGVEGVKFIEKCVESAEKGAVWVDY